MPSTASAKSWRSHSRKVASTSSRAAAGSCPRRLAYSSSCALRFGLSGIIFIGDLIFPTIIVRGFGGPGQKLFDTTRFRIEQTVANFNADRDALLHYPV